MTFPIVDRTDAGYATAAAALICLVLATTVSAVMAYALHARRLADASLERAKAELALDGAHILAAAGISKNLHGGRLFWTEGQGEQVFTILAEPEFDKLKAADVKAGSPAIVQLGATNPDKIVAEIAGAIAADQARSFAGMDPAPLWRRCADSVLSFFGEAEEVQLSPPRPPDTEGLRIHVGEVWRVRVSAQGWSDDRIVRITGSALAPISNIRRTFGRDAVGGEPCGELMIRA